MLGSASIASAQAKHMSGQDYLNKVNEQLVAAGRPTMQGSSATALVGIINSMGDTEFGYLQRANDTRTANGATWLTTGGDITRVTADATLDPETGVVDPTKLEKVAAENAIQKPAGCSILKWNFEDCIAGPIARFASRMMLSLGGNILRLSGSIFDFGVNHVIIDFKATLSGPLMTIIDGGWTFFRDIANIFIIGIFTFIAISLILGLKEYGQKKLVARVLIIAVLMNFSLLFTKIIIDSSNFIAYAIYSQTAGAGAPTFSIADKVLSPLHVTGVWDTSALAQQVYGQENSGGALKAFGFGLFGFIILVLLAAVIFYGAFLIIARAIMFVVLMLTAPIAYATYLAPNFEASEFGWSNWWKSLINNAAFAPLLMIFLSIAILIMQTASTSVNPADTLGALGTDPTKQVLADGWKVLFVYILGTGLLFISFRLSSSLAGSISGIKVGQMIAGVPLALGTRGAARLAQLSAGRASQALANNADDRMKKARLHAIATQDQKDWDKVERIRKQKAAFDKGAQSSFNPLNTALGKALAGSAGLKGVLAGEKKGSFAGSMEDRAKAAEAKAKAMQLTEADKKEMRKQASEEIQAANNTKLDEAAKNLETAKLELEKAKTEQAASQNPELVREVEEAVTKNAIARAPDMDKAQTEVHVIEQRKSEIVGGHDSAINEMVKKTEELSGQARENHVRQLEARRAERQTAIKQQDAHIADARERITTLKKEIEAPRTELLKRQEKAARELAERNAGVQSAEGTLATAKTKAEAVPNAAEVQKLGNAKIKTAEEAVAGGVQGLSRKEAGILGGHAGEHVIQHHMDATFKKKTGAESIAEAVKGIQAAAKKEES